MPAPSASARSYQQVLTRLLRHGSYAQLRKIIDKTLAADIAPVLPLLLDDDRNRVLSLLIEAGKAARALLALDISHLHQLPDTLDDATLAPIFSSSAPDHAPDLLHPLASHRPPP